MCEKASPPTIQSGEFSCRFPAPFLTIHARRNLYKLLSAMSRMEKVMDKNRTEGAKHEVKGAVKEIAGKITGNKGKEDAGNSEKYAGKLEKEAGKSADKARAEAKKH
jgi:uncharacterized protein YjbJ (UPF0337 family)